MLAVIKAIFKAKQFVEGYEKLINKKVQEIETHYNIVVDEISDERINQQTIWASAKNKNLIEKLENLCMYQQVKFIVNINFYEGKPSKIVVLDILDDDNAIKTVENVFKIQEQKLQKEREKEKQ